MVLIECRVHRSGGNIPDYLRVNVEGDKDSAVGKPVFANISAKTERFAACDIYRIRFLTVPPIQLLKLFAEDVRGILHIEGTGHIQPVFRRSFKEALFGDPVKFGISVSGEKHHVF